MMPMRTPILVVAFLSAAVPSYGVCLNGYPTVSTEYRESALVLSAKVISIRTVPATRNDFFLDGDMTRIQVIETYRGRVGRTVDVFSENSSGRFPMEAGKCYLLFLHRVKGRLVADNCGNSAALSESVGTVKQLKGFTGRR